jgi:molybdenum cofactor cytidylyltransferase
MPAPADPFRVAGVLLAAGASRRMGVNKLLQSFGSTTLVEHSTAAAITAGLDPVVVVLGRDADVVRRLLARHRCRFAINPSPDSTSGSLRLGLEAVAGDGDAVVVLLADMPLVSAAMLAQLLDTARRRDAPIVASRYGGVIAPPVLFRRELVPELMAWNGDGGARPIVERHRARTLFVDWPADRLGDIDTAADLARLRDRDRTHS